MNELVSTFNLAVIRADVRQNKAAAKNSGEKSDSGVGVGCLPTLVLRPLSDRQSQFLPHPPAGPTQPGIRVLIRLWYIRWYTLKMKQYFSVYSKPQ